MTTEGAAPAAEQFRLDGRRTVFWLNRMWPGLDAGTFRVCAVQENEPGYLLMGDERRGQQPWYWDEETCRDQNRKNGYSDEDVFRIVGSSMASSRKTMSRRSRRAGSF